MKKHLLNDTAGYLILLRTIPNCGQVRDLCYWGVFLSLIWGNLGQLSAQPLAPSIATTDVPDWLVGVQYRSEWTAHVPISRIDPSVVPFSVLRADSQRKDGVWVRDAESGKYHRLWPMKQDPAVHPFGGFMAMHLAEALDLPVSPFEIRRWWGRPAIWEQTQAGDENQTVLPDTLLKRFKARKLIGGVDVFKYATFRLLGILLGSPEHTPQTWRPYGEGKEVVYVPLWSPFLGMNRHDGFMNRVLALHDSRLKRSEFGGKTEDLIGFITVNTSDLAFLADWTPENWATLLAFMQGKLQPEVIREAVHKMPNTLDELSRNALAEVLLARISHLPVAVKTFAATIQRAQKGTYRKPFTVIVPYGETNSTDWVLGGLSLQRVIRGYHPVYTRAYQLTADVSPITGGFNVWGHTDAPHIWGKWGFFGEAHALAPTNFHAFYKLGNESPKNDNRYYDAKRQRFRLWTSLDWSSSTLKQRLRVGPFWESINLEEARINGTGDVGLLPDIYADRTFGGLEVRLQTNRTDHPTFPKRGMKAFLQAKHYRHLTHTDEVFTTLSGEVSVYLPFSFVPGLLALRLGGGHLLGEFPYYAAHRIGQFNYLRGYFQRRFGGRSMAFTNLEARSELFSRNVFGQSITSGWLTFADAGRVWADGEQSKRIHVGYGVGGWTKAGNMVVSGWVAFSDEYPRGLPLARVGFQF